MDANAKRYLREFLTSMAAYAVMVPVSIWLLKNHEHSALRFLFAGLPVIPSAFAMWAAIRSFRGMDELQRRIQFEGMAFAFLELASSVLPGDFCRTQGCLMPM